MSGSAAFGATTPARATVGAGRRVAGWLAAALAALALALPAAAQDDVQYLPRDIYRDAMGREGNRIVFCYNPDGMMAEFEQELAQVIADVLLVEARIRPFEGAFISTPPYDHRFPLMPEQLFIMLNEQCTAMIGYALAPNSPEWLAITRPYMQGRMLMITTDPTLRRVEDLPYDRPIGARGMSAADNRLINYLQARPAEQRWQRFPFFSNAIVVEKLVDGTIGMGLIWEPALMVMTEGDPEAAGFHVIETLPFSADPIEIGIATRSQDRYLSEMLNEAIAALLADGTVDELLEKHHLQRPRED